MNSDFWNGIKQVAANTADARPDKGKRVVVIDGRKYKGKSGVVFWHGADKFSPAWRYSDAAQRVMTEIMGRYGYRVGIEADDGTRFFVSADKVEVLS